MLAGELYDAGDPELVADRRRCEQLLRSFNDAPDDEARCAVLAELLGEMGEGSEIRPPFACDYGYNIALGAGAFLNFGCVILDVVQVTIGDRAQLASGVQLLAADHPLDPAIRRTGREFGRPITIGANAWLGAGAIVCPGVNVGEDSVIGAGSVVTRDIPAGVLAVGSPCRVVRELPAGEPPG
jgi:maltose O-acetyltransferase